MTLQCAVSCGSAAVYTTLSRFLIVILILLLGPVFVVLPVFDETRDPTEAVLCSGVVLGDLKCVTGVNM